MEPLWYQTRAITLKALDFIVKKKRGISGDYILQKTTSMSLKMVTLLWTGVFSLLRSFIFSERRTKCYTRKIISRDYGTLLKRQSSGSNPGNPPGWSKISLPSKFSGFHEELQEANLLQSACTVE
jgi:hypothetical protein